jgi:hypothetical protein
VGWDGNGRNEFSNLKRVSRDRGQKRNEAEKENKRMAEKEIEKKRKIQRDKKK